MKAKTYLITGAAGFIGYHLATELLAQGATVIGVDNLNADYQVSLKMYRKNCLCQHKKFSFHQVDILDLPTLEPIVKQSKIAAIIHLAAKAGVRRSQEFPQDYAITNIVGTLNILELAQKEGIKNTILASSSSIYSNVEPPFSETQVTDSPLSPYAASKKAMELFAYSYHNMYEMNITLLRFFSVYGPLGRPDMCVGKFIGQLQAGEPLTIFGDGEQQRSLTYIKDIVSGILLTLNLKGFHIYNLGNEKETTSVKDLLYLLEQQLKKKAVVNYAPASKTDALITQPDISKAKRELGWQPNTLIAEGLEETVLASDPSKAFCKQQNRSG